MIVVRSYVIASVILSILIILLSYTYIRSSDLSIPSQWSGVSQPDNAGPPTFAIDVNTVPTATSQPGGKSYMVRYKILDTPDPIIKIAMKMAKSMGGTITREYNDAKRGFLMTLPSGINSKKALAAIDESMRYDFPFTISEEKS
ncbi:hypothetical protein POJ06DRAFT_255294 [Lipomyces tetrasporus]|uniref:Uncharacterized protein n=1 Tax=Lipomyces tetrasporus TaxID=54092 RepID=A0AAD7VTE1_9ASCO|nr:uncharacterized protein POJ06DRAFT_255294 [Lipomyces tetrasporus]KAJ8100060.1 hypothetical protein POJ06DRAFT_255294 [Lipomyces tetrasporus]